MLERALVWAGRGNQQGGKEAKVFFLLSLCSVVMHFCFGRRNGRKATKGAISLLSAAADSKTRPSAISAQPPPFGGFYHLLQEREEEVGGINMSNRCCSLAATPRKDWRKFFSPPTKKKR